MSETARYLLAAFLAERRHSPPVSTGQVADAVGRSPSATTEMLQRLESRGLLTHEPYEGVTLSDEGREAAEQLHESYLVLARFFRDVLDIDDYAEEAMDVAGTVSPSVAERLSETLLESTGRGVGSATST